MNSDRLIAELKQKVDFRLKSLFLAKGMFAVRNYRPPTGIGLFDLYYDIAARTVEVKVRVRFNFLDNSPGAVPALNQSTYIKWTHAEKDAFRTKALKVCNEAWSGKYRFQCNRKGWGHFCASVNISMVEDKDPHYQIDCRKVAVSDSSAWSGGCEHGATTWPYRANFSNWAVEERSDFLGANVFNFKEKQLIQILKQSGLEKIRIAIPGSVDADPSQYAKLSALAQKVSQIIQDDVSGIHCNIYGFTTSGIYSYASYINPLAYYNPNAYNITRAKRATALQDRLNHLLNGRGNRGMFFRASETEDSRRTAEAILRRDNIDPAGFDGVCLFIYVPPDSPRIVPTNYIVITHEFGHMLGCPDEYTGVLCTGIKALMSVDEIVQATFSQPLLNASQLNPPGPSRHFLNESMTGTAAANVKRSFQQQKTFAYQVEQAGVASPYFMAQQNVLNESEVAASQEAWYAERDRIKKIHGRESRDYEKFANTQYLQGKTGASDSIMFTGQKILPAHYLPIWSCLTSATREFLDPSEWSIV